MAFSINTNVSAMKANMYSNLSTKSLDKSIEALASGVSAADASALAMADTASAQVLGMGQGMQNANESIGMIQIADGAMSGINDNMQRIRTLTLQASNDTLSADDRSIIQTEIDSLVKSSNDISNSTRYNGIKLLDGSGGSTNNGTFTTQTGANAGETSSITIGDTTSLLGNIDVTTESGRESALKSIDTALEDLGAMRSDLGAAQNQLMSSVNNTYISQVNTAASESRLRDVDFAQESANFSSANLLSQTGIFAQSQANSLNSNVAGLFG
jgi:flagellin